MTQSKQARARLLHRQILGGTALALALGLGLGFSAQAPEPIKIGVIGEESSVAGASLTKAAAMAADDINAKGGVNGRPVRSSPTTITLRPPTVSAPSSGQ